VNDRTLPIPPRPDLAGRPQPVLRSPRRAPVAVITVLALLGSILGGLVIVWVEMPDSEGSYRFIGEAAGAPIRWNPCEPVRYEVNLANAPEGALAVVHEAFDRTAEVTGIEFRFEGTTTRTPEEQADDYFLSHLTDPVVWLPVLVAWLPREEFRAQFERLGSDRHALAVANSIRGELETADQYTSGAIVVDAEARMSDDFDGRYSLGMVMMHEAGHLMGLGHVKDPAEVMFSDRSTYPQPIEEWGPGDTEGLQRLGTGGCMDPVPVAP